MNQVSLVGNVVRDFELRNYEKGVFVNFHIAINEYNYKTKESIASFIEITAFGKLAETLATYLRKGRRIGIQGKLSQNSYVNEDGNRVYKVNVIANEVQFLDGKKQEAV